MLSCPLPLRAAAKRERKMLKPHKDQNTKLRAVPTAINTSFLSVLKRTKWVRWRTKFNERERAYNNKPFLTGETKSTLATRHIDTSKSPLGSEKFIIAKYLLSWASYHYRRWFLVIIFSDMVALDFARGVYRWDCP